MNINKRILLSGLSAMCFLLLSSQGALSQDMSFNYTYRIEMSNANIPPVITAFPSFNYPEEARKNGVEGTLKANMILGEDGKVKDIVIDEGLPNGVSEELTKKLHLLGFVPAKTRGGQPAAVKLYLNYVITAVYDETDKDVTKPKIIEKPVPIYPENQKAEKLKDKVTVSILFFADGTLKILGASSTMPNEFDKSALEAAKSIKFQPAVHKKSKKNVSQKMTVEFAFKP